MGNLIVSDEDYNAFEESLNAFADAAESRLIRYISIMKNVQSTAIHDGHISVRLDDFIKSTESLLKETIRTQSITVGLCINRYLLDIDEKDQYLY